MLSDRDDMADSLVDDQLQWSFLSNLTSNLATDNHLQNLGLDISDGLPKFKLNEPVSVGLTTNVLQQNDTVSDESDQSFVVLGKTSLEAIRQNSLANYKLIQQTNIFSDHILLTSMMDPSQIEDNLKKVLEENVKLKQTLQQNNNALKQQLNTITKWQKEVIETCDNHKRKFIETKELISRLKQENEELNKKIAAHQTAQDTSLLKHHDVKSFDKMFTKERIETQHQSETFSKKLSTSSNEICKETKELETFKIQSDMPHSLEIEKLIGKCCEKDYEKEINYLKEIITSLENQIKKLNDNIFTLNVLPIETPQKDSKEQCLLNQNIEFYTMKIREMGKCFTLQCSRFLKVQTILNESVNIIQFLENAMTLTKNMLSEDKIKNCTDKLCSYRKELIDEQLKSIDDKQIITKVQKQFQNILSDYSSVVSELDILKDENTKIMIQLKTDEEKLQQLTEIEKRLKNNEQILEKEKNVFQEAQLNLQMEKKNVMDEKEKIEVELKSLCLEKEKLIEERTNLLEERTSLDQQSRLYEAEEHSLQKEKKDLQKTNENLQCTIDSLRQELSACKTTIQALNAENYKLKGNEETISIYKIQTEIREKEFDEMRMSLSLIQNELQKLTVDNLQLRTVNDCLVTEAGELSRYCVFCTKYIISSEQHGMGICDQNLD